MLLQDVLKIFLVEEGFDLLVENEENPAKMQILEKKNMEGSMDVILVVRAF